MPKPLHRRVGPRVIDTHPPARSDYAGPVTKGGAIRAACLAVVVCLLPALPAQARRRVLLPDCGHSIYGGSAAPSRWDAGCTGDPELLETTWSRWGRRSARGTGMTAHNDCDPNCADGTVYYFDARALSFRIRRCQVESGREHLFYTRVKISWIVPPDHESGVDEGEDSYTFKNTCVR